MSRKNQYLTVIAFVNVVVIAIFFYIYKTNPDLVLKPIQKEVPNTGIQDRNLGICEDFSKLSDFVVKAIQAPEKQVLNEEVIIDPKDNVYSIKNFYQSRGNSKEPVLGYPIKIGSYFTYQSDGPIFKSPKDLISIFNLNSKSLTENINNEAIRLGLEVDEVNNVFLKNSGNNLRQKFAFIKGRSVYSIELKFKELTQAVPEHDIEVTCGSVLNDYDSIYNSVIKSALNNWQEDEYLRVAEISDDGKVVAIENNYLDSSSMSDSKGTLGTTFLKYYILDAGSYKSLTEAESNFVDCGFLENLKIGKGMNCMRKENNSESSSFSKVTYE